MFSAVQQALCSKWLAATTKCHNDKYQRPLDRSQFLRASSTELLQWKCPSAATFIIQEDKEKNLSHFLAASIKLKHNRNQHFLLPIKFLCKKGLCYYQWYHTCSPWLQRVHVALRLGHTYGNIHLIIKVVFFSVIRFLDSTVYSSWKKKMPRSFLVY